MKTANLEGRKAGTELNPSALHHCPRCGRSGFTARGMKAHQCKSPFLQPGQVICCCGLICGSEKSLMDHMRGCDRVPANVEIGPGMFGRGVEPMAAQRAALPPTSPLEATPPQTETPRHVGPMDTKTALSKRPLIHRPLKELTIHAAIADDPRMAPKDPRYVAMKTAWSEQGGCPPIYVTASGAIVDGRHRYWWLVDADEDTAPCIEVSEDEVFTIILGAIAGRNHQTQGQRAYFAAAKLGPALEAAKVRRDEQLRTGGKVKLAPLPTADEFAEQLHLGRNLLFQARRLHEVFADGKPGAKLRKEWEPKILDAEDPVGLGAALAGIAGASATKGKGKPDRNSALNNWEAGWKNLVNPAKKFASWDEEQRDYAAESLRKTLTKLPGEVLELVIASARAAKKAVDAASATPTEG